MSKNQTQNPITMGDVIDRLFTRLAASYGAEWTRQWAKVPMNDVKTAWSYELGGYISHLSAIAYALDNLPERCPSLIAFRNICRAAPGRVVPMIESPKADPERIAAALATLAPATPRTDGHEWARRIIARHKQGDKLMPYSLNLAQSAMGIKKGALE